MILNGICVREKVLEELKSNLNSLKVSLCLAIIQVSKDSASSLYIKEKIALAETLGYKYKYVSLSFIFKPIRGFILWLLHAKKNSIVPYKLSSHIPHT